MAESTSTPLDSNPDTSDKIAPVNVHLPRISIQFCTQCRWMLRAAYFAQELLSTFSTDLGEVALVPKTGGVFTVTIWHGTMKDGEITTQESILWDRKRDGGVPWDLGHTDRALKKEQGEQESKKEEESKGKAGCEDCQ
ncbi:hypothetical protein N7519_000928 [Penicillium mononematosum]|uniref:uncharacterized protein n=1 Tax=Penicillium mononematosum TaxID=268346 RepID=UPI002549B96B|nr:uncharacterized protein N7519_000928 [Penicillium mononematosum]KAJ6190907.1 hypothetical protein N7519_000928 [Penicillium mononematosum]